MAHHFSVHTGNGYMRMLEQYKAIHGQLGTVRFLPNHAAGSGVVYDIKPEYGQGTLQMYLLQANVMLLIYDFVLTDEMVTAFDLDDDYFELEYCIDGSMHIHERQAGEARFAANELSVSLSQAVSGNIRRSAGQAYRGVSITGSRAALPAYFGSAGIGIWNETIERMDARERAEYYLGAQASPEIASAFLQIYHCRLPVLTRALFYESKVSEILSAIVSLEIERVSDYVAISLSPHEYRQIKQIPRLLMESPEECPTLSSLSDQLGIALKRLTKGFKMLYGDTIFSYHRKQTLQQASSLLLGTDRSVSEIAYEVGYSNPSNFGVAFKKHFGMTPMQYRETSILHKR